MIVDGVRLFLLAGLIIHKFVWEVLSRRLASSKDAAPQRRSGLSRVLKGVKLAILAGLVGQAVSPEILPIATAPAALRVLGIALFTLGLVVAILGRVQLGHNWADIEAAQVLQGQSVVETGIYRYVRHPIYAGDLLLLIGFELSLNSWLVLAVAALVPYVVWRALREERMLSERLPGYDGYQGRTYRFVPFVV